MIRKCSLRPDRAQLNNIIQPMLLQVWGFGGDIRALVSLDPLVYRYDNRYN